MDSATALDIFTVFQQTSPTIHHYNSFHPANTNSPLHPLALRLDVSLNIMIQEKTVSWTGSFSQILSWFSWQQRLSALSLAVTESLLG